MIRQLCLFTHLIPIIVNKMPGAFKELEIGTNMSNSFSDLRVDDLMNVR